MTAQTTTRTPASGTRVAPMIVVIIAILAFAGGLALAQVIAPDATSTAATVADPLTVRDVPEQVAAPGTGTWRGVFRNPSIDEVSASDPAATIATSPAFAEGRNR